MTDYGFYISVSVSNNINFIIMKEKNLSKNLDNIEISISVEKYPLGGDNDFGTEKEGLVSIGERSQIIQ